MKKNVVLLIVLVFALTFITGCLDTQTKDDVAEVKVKLEEMQNEMDTMKIQIDRLNNEVFPKAEEKTEEVKKEASGEKTNVKKTAPPKK